MICDRHDICLGKLQSAFGSDMTLLQTFRYWRTMCLNIMKEQGSWDVYIRWGDDETVRTLIVRIIKETRIEDPEDEIWEWNSYLAAHGPHQSQDFVCCSTLFRHL
jgi:hypothetical protein